MAAGGLYSGSSAGGHARALFLQVEWAIRIVLDPLEGTRSAGFAAEFSDVFHSHIVVLAGTGKNFDQGDNRTPWSILKMSWAQSTVESHVDW